MKRERSFGNRKNESIVSLGEYGYRVKDELGRGFSSCVYKGFHIFRKQSVAVKVIQKEFLESDINRCLLNSQLAILKTVRNLPNILHLHNVISNENRTYIITELCGSDVGEKIPSKLSKPKIEKYVKQIINGFKQLYQKQIIHRDLKPANLLLTANDDLKIADFGFAIKTKDAKLQSKYNIGSPLYMAPETLRRNQYSHQSDMWAIGIIIFEMCTGETPWKAETQKQLLENMKNQRIDTLLQKADIPSPMRQLVARLLVFDRRLRISEREFISWKRGNSVLKERSNTQVTPPPKYHPPIMPKTLQNKRNITFNEGFNSTKPSKNENQPPVKVCQKLGKAQIKKITKMLIGQIHVCRLLYKIMMLINKSKKDGLLQHNLQSQRKSLMKCYSNIIVKIIDRLINFSNYNFLHMPVQQVTQYIESGEYNKLKKVCEDYKRKYQNSEQMKELWRQAIEPNNQQSIKETTRMIGSLWPLVKEHHHEEISLTQLLIFGRRMLGLLRTGAYHQVMQTQIQDLIDQQITNHSELFSHVSEQVEQVLREKSLSIDGRTKKRLSFT